jgi:hypothetical protein
MPTVTYTPPGVQLSAFALQTAVYVYDVTADDGNSLTLLPNVQCWEIQTKEGNDPPTAHLSYILDDRSLSMGIPSQFQQLWPLDLPTPNLVGSYIATPSLRIVVQGMYPDGSFRTLFDGFPRMPTTQVAGNNQAVTFGAVGVAIRAWDSPIKGRFERDNDDPNEGNIFFINRPCRFNPVHPGDPSGQPNCTPDDADVNEGDDSISYPVFLDPSIQRTPDPRTFWTLGKAVRYILSKYNPPSDDEEDEDQDGGDSGNATYHQFIQNPDFSQLSEILDNRRPKDGMEYYDPNDPSTYDASPIILRDFDCTNMAWPDALERLLGYNGFGMSWVLQQDDFGQPNNTFNVYRKDAGNPAAPKVLLFAVDGTPMNPATQNVGTLHGSFDYHGVANQFIIESHPNRYEVSIVLAPGFTPTKGDELAASRKQFLKQNLDGATKEIRQKYRYYIADECGDGYFNDRTGQTTGATGTTGGVPTSGTGGGVGGGKPKGGTPIPGMFVTGTALDLGSLWPDVDPGDGTTPVSPYVVRYRPCAKKLLTLDGNGDEYKAQLAFSRDYTGEVAVLWDGKTGHWQPIDDGSWELLPDRIGIMFTSEDPEAIKIGAYTGGNPQEKSKILRGITCQANPKPFPIPPLADTNQSQQLFFLRLTTVIESDTTLEATAPRRDASPLPNIVERRIDAKEHWRYDVVTKNSAFFTVASANFAPDEGNADDTDDRDQIVLDKQGNLVIRDDTAAATDYATQLRSVHEFPMCSTAFTIPTFTMAYNIGDRISLISGRNVSLQTNAGTEQQEGEQFPTVVGVSWDFQTHQTTTLQLADRRREPQTPNARVGHRTVN